MRQRTPIRVTAAALLAACSTAVAIDNQPMPQAGNDLLQHYPGLRAFHDQGRVRTFTGVPMTSGLTPQDAAASWIQLHGEAFGVGPLSVESLWVTPVMDGRFTAFGYRQTINGHPVEFGNFRILVLNEPVPRVVYAAGTLAPVPADAAQRQIVTANLAAQLAQGQPTAKGIDVWRAPEMIIWQGNGEWTSPITAWKVIGHSSNPSDKLSRKYIINSVTGAIAADLDEIVYTDVGGTVRAMATPGVASDNPANPPVLMTMPEAKVTITAGGSAYTDRNGVYTIINPGVTPVTVNSGVGVAQGFGGRWVNVIPNDGSTPVTASVANVTPPGPGDITLNAVPSERLTAQVNILRCTDITHNYFKDRAPAFNLLDVVIPANTGVAGTCNAFFDPAAVNINFYNSGGGCYNTSFSNVVSHEYGHFIVQQLGLAQGGFGEGYGDVNAMMIWDDSIVGRGFRTTSPDYVRDPIGANIQYPCSASCGGEVHCCGQLLGASWWRIRTAFGTQYGSAPGLDMTRSREVAWSLITIGGSGTSAMSGTNGQTTAIEILTVDDDDGNVNNGTPNRNLICPALAQGSVICPALSLLSFTYPNGRPASLTPGSPTPINVNVGSLSATPAPGTGTISYRVNGGSYTTISMAQGAANQYTATLPSLSCGQVVDYYFTAQAQGGGSQTDPANAPTATYSAIANAGAINTTIADLNFNADPGWTRTLNGTGTMTTGQWDRGVPVAGSGGVTADYNGGGGQCWVTDNRAGAAGAFDLDGGPSTLTTNAYNLSGYAGAQVSFALWFNSVNGVTDNLNFEYSTNNGSSWTVLATYPSSSGWSLKTLNVPTLSAQTMFRWNVSDQPNDSVTEGGIDAFKLTAYSCSAAACYANCDGSTGSPQLTANDFQCFINAFAAGQSYANCDGSTGSPALTANDFQCFINTFAAGCS